MTTAGADRSRGVYLHTIAMMGTVVTIQVVERGVPRSDGVDRDRAIDLALAWFRRVEAACSRFDDTSELRRLSTQVGVAVPASPMLFEAVRFALAVAAETGGAFDPAIGGDMEARGFNRHYRTGQTVSSGVKRESAASSYRHVELDAERLTITLRRPLALDLGAVAKGLAVDMAARELRPLEHYAIDAGGDLYFAGRNVDDEPWAAGLRHPRDPGRLLETLRVSNAAVCTSGDYERTGIDGIAGHHLLDARTGRTADRAVSVTVVAPTAMAADALATAAFVLGPADGLRLLESQGVEGLIVSPALERFETPGLRAHLPI